jgi:hypothetical protein
LPDKSILGDVTVIHPTSKSYRKLVLKRGAEAVGDRSAAGKEQKYDEMAAAIDMVSYPIVLYTYGGFHKSALSFIAQLVDSFDPLISLLSRSEFKQSLMKHIAIAVQRGTADIMIQDMQGGRRGMGRHSLQGRPHSRRLRRQHQRRSELDEAATEHHAGWDTGALSAVSLPSSPDQVGAGCVHSDGKGARVNRVGDGGMGDGDGMESGGGPSSTLTGVVHANESAPLMSGDTVCSVYEGLMRVAVNSARSEPVDVDVSHCGDCDDGASVVVSVCMNVDDGDECVSAPPPGADLSPIISCTMQSQCAECSHSHSGQSVGLLVDALLVDNCPVTADGCLDGVRMEVGQEADC